MFAILILTWSCGPPRLHRQYSILARILYLKFFAWVFFFSFFFSTLGPIATNKQLTIYTLNQERILCCPNDPASSCFSLAWLLAFTKSFAWLVCRVVEKLTTRQTSHANDFVNAKSHAKKKPLLAGKSDRHLAYLDCDEVFQRFGHFASFYGQMSSM